MEGISPNTLRRPSSSQQSMNEALKEFLGAVTENDLESAYLNSACNWYTAYLESKITENWVPLFRPVLMGINSSAVVPSESDISIAFRLFTAIVEQFKRKELAWTEIVDGLYNLGLLQDTDDDRSHAFHLALVAVGWNSMSYLPHLP